MVSAPPLMKVLYWLDIAPFFQISKIRALFVAFIKKESLSLLI